MLSWGAVKSGEREQLRCFINVSKLAKSRNASLPVRERGSSCSTSLQFLLLYWQESVKQGQQAGLREAGPERVLGSYECCGE